MRLPGIAVVVVVVVLGARSGGGDKPRTGGGGTVVEAPRDAAVVAAIDGTPAPPPVALPGVDLLGDPLPLPDRVSASLGSPRLRHGDGATYVSWSGDGAHLVTAGGDAIRVWTPGGALEREHTATNTELDVAITSADGQTVIGGESMVVAWGPDGNERWRVDLDDETLSDLALSPDGTLVAAAAENLINDADGPPPSRGLWVIDVATGKQPWRLTDTDARPERSVAFSPDGKLLAVSGQGTHVYDVSSGKRVQKLKGGGTDVTFTPDGKALIWIDYSEVVRHDLKSKKEKRRVLEKEQFVEAIMLSPDGATVVACVGGEVRVLDAVTLAEQRVHEGAGGWVVHAELSPDGTRLAIAIEKAHVRLLDLASGAFEAPAPGHLGEVTKVAFSPAGDRVATGGADATVLIWDLAGNLTATVAGHRGIVTGLSFSADGAQLVSLDREGRVIVSTVADGTEVARLDLDDTSWHTDVLLLPDGRVLIAISYAPALVWTIGGKPEPMPAQPDESGYDAFALSPDQRLVYAGSDSVLLDATTLEPVREIEAGGKVHDAAFSRDGTMVVAGSANGVSLGEVATGKELGRLSGAQDSGVAWGPDDAWLVTTGKGTVTRSTIDRMTWKAVVMETLDPWPAGSHDGSPAVAVSPDGRRIVTGHSNGLALIWAAP